MPRKEKETIKEEPLSDLIDAETLKILDKKVSDIDKQIKDESNEQLIEKAEAQTLKPTQELDGINQITFYMDFIATMILTFLNPILQKNNIEPITQAEAKELTTALLSIASEKALSTTGKITTAISKVVNFPKILKLITVLWKIAYPRLNKYLENKKSKGEFAK